MADQAELIHGNMDETRAALADKLGQLGQQITGTVEEVTETVGDAVEAVGDTVESVTDATQQTVHAIKDAFNLPKHIRTNPWLWVGGSLILGYLGGRLFAGSSNRRTEVERDREEKNERSPSFIPALSESAKSASQTAETTSSHSDANQPQDEKSTGWLGNLSEKFGSEIGTLKSLAVGTAFGVVRDIVTESLPESLKGELSSVIDNMTEGAGGKPIKGSVMEKSSEKPEENSGDQKENSGDQEEDSGKASGKPNGRHPAENWNPSGERKNRSSERQTSTTDQNYRRRH